MSANLCFLYFAMDLLPLKCHGCRGNDMLYHQLLHYLFKTKSKEVINCFHFIFSETNLKVKQSLPHLGDFKDDLDALSDFKGRLELNKFYLSSCSA